LGIRKRGLLNSQKSCNTKIVDIDTIQYDNYVRGSNMTSDTECNVEMPNDEELNNIRKQLTTLGGDIAKQMSELYKIDNKIYINTFNKNKEDIIYGLQINGEIKGISLSIITLIIEIIEKYKNVDNKNWNIICLS